MLTLSLAHSDLPSAPHDLWGVWSLDPRVITPLVFLALVTWLGLRRAPTSVRPPTRALVGSGLGLAAVLIAVASPLDVAASAGVSAHMVQHVVLVLIAAPLLAAGAPWRLWVWVLPRAGRKLVGRHRRRVGVGVSRLLGPLAAGGAMVVTISLWHARSFYEAALANDVVHGIEHATFLVAALWMWRVVLGLGTGPAPLLMLFVVALHGVLLSALMTFASTAWYPAYADKTPMWGLAPLDDQRLAGVILWVSGSLAYVAGAVTTLIRWLDRSEAQALVVSDRDKPRTRSTEVAGTRRA